MGRWGSEGPPPEAYGRVTNSERFAPVVDAADELVERLVAAYDVTATRVRLERASRAVRLQPTVGAQLTIGITAWSGAILCFGHWSGHAVPMCACDACDETAEQAIDLMTETVDEVVGGKLVERLTRWPRRLWHETDGGHGWVALGKDHFEELAAVAPPGRHAWPAWPRRTAAEGPPSA